MSDQSVFEQRANFRVVHVIVRNHAGDILLQKIAPGLRHSGAWGSSVAGYLKAGETYRQAAFRKLFDELGIHTTKLKSHGRTLMLDNGCKKFIGVYSLQRDGQFTFLSNQATGIEFLPVRDVRDACQSGRREFTATFVHVMRYLDASGFGANSDP